METINKDYKILPVPFTAINITDEFWQPRIQTNHQKTIPDVLAKCEETHRIENFAVAGGIRPGTFKGIRFNDSDVFKAIEGAAYSLNIHPDQKLEADIDEIIRLITAAQEDDGYLYTIRTIPNGILKDRSAGTERWAFTEQSHELYNVGHIYEAAIAYYQTTGKDQFLQVAIKNANLVLKTFGPNPNQLKDVPGHQEIEIGLIKLFRITGNQKYLELAKFFLDQRGQPSRKLYGNNEYPDIFQDHAPVIDQREVVGHAVRANYMYSAMADIAAIQDNKEYHRAIQALWLNMVNEKLYLTGGVGSYHHHEHFGEGYHLPNLSAYNETCAAIANALWNHRMFLLEGDAKYIDVLERIIYNGFLSGISFSGTEYFYPNPLECDVKYKFNQGQTATRKPWFNCSCCPTNIVRFLPSLMGYIYATHSESPIIYCNLFIQGTAKININNPNLSIVVNNQTNYPWDGKSRFIIDSIQLPKENELENAQQTTKDSIPHEFSFAIRIPGWLTHPVPSHLYHYNQQHEIQIKFSDVQKMVSLKINEKSISITDNNPEIQLKKGYLVISRTWNEQDSIEIEFPMKIQKVFASTQVEADRNKLALERGPLVYCLEQPDNKIDLFSITIPKNQEFQINEIKSFFSGVSIIGQAKISKKPSIKGSFWKRIFNKRQVPEEYLAPALKCNTLTSQPVNLTWIPYYAWSNRGENQMRVWIPYCD